MSYRNDILASKNGITVKDMVREVDKVRKETRQETTIDVLKTVYASLSIVMKENLQFSQEECLDVLRDVDKRFLETVNNEDLVKEAEMKVGILFSLENGGERIKVA